MEDGGSSPGVAAGDGNRSPPPDARSCYSFQ